MTNKNAKFRPQLVDLTPSDYARQQTREVRDASHGSAFSVSAIADSVLRATSRTQSGSSRHSGQTERKSEFRSRPSAKPAMAQVAHAGTGRHAGAIRNNALQQNQSPSHLGKVSAALVIIAGAVVWTSGESQTQTNTSTPIPTSVAKASVVPAPDFFFADKADALALADIQEYASPEAVEQSAPPAIADIVQSETTKPETTAPVAVRVPTTGPSVLPTEIAAAYPELDSQQPDNLIDSPSQTLSSESLERLITVESGNTLSGILNSNGVKIEQLSQLLTNQIVKDNLSNLNVNQVLALTLSPDGDFSKLTTRVGADKRINIEMVNGDFDVSAVDLPLTSIRTVTTGSIEQSLYLAAEKANLKQSTIMGLADIFQWELDFARDIREGDQFSLVYDRLFREGEYIGDGDILAAEFIRGGKTHTAIRFTTDENVTGYYSPEGKSKRRTFMRHPVDVVRITSKFNPNRLHPVLHKIRAHRGVDYGSPYGSPIYATADGRVSFAGSKNAYGKTVVLQHGEKFSTLYAHMSKISGKSKVGKRVAQGDVIGYVGNSGRVTGTHLHYEFRVNNKQIDPLKVELPAAQPIDKKYLGELQKRAKSMKALMEQAKTSADDQVASARR